MRALESASLQATIGATQRDLIALVGGGGKTAALQLLVRESSAGNGKSRILATTTTMMFLSQLEAVGPVIVQPSLPLLRSELAERIYGGGAVGAARAVQPDGKALGLPIEWIDDLWSAGVIDELVVEADGSRGLSLKAFASYEPEVPLATTVLMQVVGMDVLGMPLCELYVHRASLLALLLDVPLGTLVTQSLLTEAIRAQLRILRSRWPAIRLVTLLNKAEEPGVRDVAVALGRELLALPENDEDSIRAYSVVVGSVWLRRFTTLSEARVDCLKGSA
jgi:probable selenium-dependent hydroxylase accessory protein YqeC